MALLKLLLWLLGFEEVATTKQQPIPEQKADEKKTQPATYQPPTMEDLAKSNDIFATETDTSADPSNDELITKYQNYRQTMDRDTAWAKITKEYKWDDAKSKAMFERITTYVQQQNEKKKREL